MEEIRWAGQFAALDWVWTVVFILLMVLCGAIFYSLAKRGESDFFLAGRGLPWWLPATSVYATHTATDTPMWISGVIYKWGLRGLWFPFFTAWCAISPFISTRILRRSMAMSMAEWQNLRYSGLGSELLRGWLAGWQTFMNMFVLAWVSAAMGKVCHYLFGWPDEFGIILFTAICAVYVLTAGYWGVIMSDFQQGVIMFIVITLVSIWGIVEAGGPFGIIAKLTELGELNRLNPINFDAFAGLDPNKMYLLDILTMFFMAILGGLGMGNFIDWYPEAQRIQSSKTVREAAYAIWGGGLLSVFRNSFWAVSIVGFFAMFPTITSEKQYEYAWFRLGFEYLPVGLIGTFFAGIIAVHLSTIASHLNLGALYATRDLYHHYINPNATEKQLVWGGRINTFILLMGSFALAIFMQSITAWLIFALWLQAAGIWVPSILQVIWWRFNSWGYLSSWIANLIMSWLVVWVLPAIGAFDFLAPVFNMTLAPGAHLELPNWINFWMLAVLVGVIYIPITFLTKPDDMDHLVKYYVQARPLGFWGPVRAEAIKRGLIEPTEVKGGLFKTDWTPEEADEWTMHEVAAGVFSVISYVGIGIGTAGVLMLQTWGFVTFGLGCAGVYLMFKVMDPKLKALSAAFEKKEDDYIKRTDQATRWEG